MVGRLTLKLPAIFTVNINIMFYVLYLIFKNDSLHQQISPPHGGHWGLASFRL